MSADNGCIGAHRRAAADGCPPEFVLPVHIGSRIIDIGENATRAAEDIVGEFHPLENRDVVLNLATTSDADARTDHHVLANGTIFTDRRPAENMAKVPDFGALSYV